MTRVPPCPHCNGTGVIYCKSCHHGGPGHKCVACDTTDSRAGELERLHDLAERLATRLDLVHRVIHLTVGIACDDSPCVTRDLLQEAFTRLDIPSPASPEVESDGALSGPAHRRPPSPPTKAVADKSGDASTTRCTEEGAGM